MNAETTKNIWRLGWLALGAFLIYKLWPYIKDLLTGGSSGSGGGPVGGASAYPGENPYGQQGGGGPQISFGGGSGSGGGSSSSGGGSFTAWLNSVINQGLGNANALGNVANGPGGDFSSLASIDAAGLPLEPIQNYNVNQNAVDLPTNSSGAGDVADSYDASSYDTSGFGNNYNQDPTYVEYAPNDYATTYSDNSSGFGDVTNADYSGD